MSCGCGPLRRRRPPRSRVRTARHCRGTPPPRARKTMSLPGAVLSARRGGPARSAPRQRTVADQYIGLMARTGARRMYRVVGDGLDPVVEAVGLHDAPCSTARLARTATQQRRRPARRPGRRALRRHRHRGLPGRGTRTRRFPGPSGPPPERDGTRPAHGNGDGRRTRHGVLRPGRSRPSRGGGGLLPVTFPALRTVALSRPGRRRRGGEWSPRWPRGAAGPGSG